MGPGLDESLYLKAGMVSLLRNGRCPDRLSVARPRPERVSLFLDAAGRQGYSRIESRVCRAYSTRKKNSPMLWITRIGAMMMNGSANEPDMSLSQTAAYGTPKPARPAMVQTKPEPVPRLRVGNSSAL